MFHKTEEKDRSDAFSYVCNRCTRCCSHREVEINPYEVARIARARNISTQECLETFVDGESMTLKRHEQSDACIFLEGDSCSIHPDRPLACRLYPLARKKSATRGEAFGLIPPDPETKGEYGQSGTIGSYLETQEIDVYTDFSDRYFQFLYDLYRAFESELSATDRIRFVVGKQQSLQNRLLTYEVFEKRLRPLLCFDVTSGAELNPEAVDSFFKKLAALLPPAPANG